MVVADGRARALGASLEREGFPLPPPSDSLSPFCSRTGSGGTGRDLLFSNPGASLPDIYLSDSVKFASEGGHFFYSIVLTHPPGMREDETVSRV